MATVTITEMAKKLGGNSADAYFDEFNEAPDRETIGDWDSQAWSIAWKELKNDGATEDDYDDCLESWRTGFFGV